MSFRVVAATVIALTGCVDVPAEPDISDLDVSIRWSSDTTRTLSVAIVNAEIPCEDPEEGFLGEDAAECTSARWTLLVDGVDVPTTPITCLSAHDAFLAGHIEKRCEGGTATFPLAETGAVDVEIVAANAFDENRIVIPDVRRTYALVEELPSIDGEPGIARTDDIDLHNGTYTAIFERPDAAPRRAFVQRAGQDPHRLELEDNLEPGDYDVRVLASKASDGVSVAVPLVGRVSVLP